MNRLMRWLFLLLFAFSCISPYAAVAGGPDEPGGKISKQDKKFKEGEILVKFKAGIPELQKDKVHAGLGSLKLKDFSMLRIQHVKLKPGMGVEEAIALYRTSPFVEYAEPNYIVSTMQYPNDPSLSELWGLNNTGQTGGTPGADISAPEAWDLTTGSSSVVVAVIDTGVDYTHPDLSANIWNNPGEIPGNGIDDDGNGWVDDVHGIDAAYGDADPMDDNNHGTHCSGTIGASGNNGIGVAGVNWNVKIMALKFLDSGGYGSLDNAITALEYVRAMKLRGVNIVATSNSWGCQDCYSQALADAIDAQRDILFIAAAGNSSVNNDNGAFSPAGYYLPNVIAVAATDHNDNKASFSNYGKRSVQVGAPGVNILSTTRNNTYSSFQGTSMAAPHVTGLAALIKAQDGTRDWRSIKNLILAGGDNTSAMSNYTSTGKRINALGSMTCANRPVFAVLKDGYGAGIGIPTTLSALSIDCDRPVGPVSVTLQDGRVLAMYDDGLGPDLAAGDGVFSCSWTATAEAETLTIASPLGSETFIVPIAPIAITTTALREAKVGVQYNETLLASGGAAPYTWSIIFGTLPTGLSLNSATGELSGIPTSSGAFGLTFQVTDGAKRSDVRTFGLFVSDYDWTRMQPGEGATGVAVDGNGNSYVTGSAFNGATQDVKLIKFDPTGNIVWTRTYDSGSYEYSRGIALDASGSIYVTGTRTNASSNDCLTLKYDAAGTLLWAKTYDGGSDDQSYGIAVDTAGNVYIAGYTYTTRNQYDYLVIKYNSTTGKAAWTKTYNGGAFEYAYGIAVDGSGNVYLTGTSNSSGTEDYLTVKFSSSGRVLWAKKYDTGANCYDRARSVAVDAAGNSYVFGYYLNMSTYASQSRMVKYDSGGNLALDLLFDWNINDEPAGIAVDGNGYIYLTTSSLNGGYAFTAKYDPAGNQVWKSKYQPSGYATSASGIALSGTGDIFVSGSAVDYVYDSRYFLLVKY